MTDSPDFPDPGAPDPDDDPDVAEAATLATAILSTLVKRGLAPETALAVLTIAWARLLAGMGFTRARYREIVAGLEGVIYGDAPGEAS